MKTEHTVQDNFLGRDEFQFIHDQLMGDHFPWNYMNGVVGYTGNDDAPPGDGKFFYYTHGFYRDNKFWTSQDWMNVITPLLEAIDPVALIRVKANMYPNVGIYHQHGWHADLEITHKAAIFYINSNNGHTVLEDGTKIESVANRLLTFDGSNKHASTTCTDQNVRVNININHI
jgi:hypothetical protein